MLGRLTCLLVAVAAVLALSPGLAAPAAADDPTPTTLALTGAPGYADRPVELVATLLTSADGEPVAGAAVQVERRTGGVWDLLATVPTDEAGRAVVEAVLSRVPADNVLRASTAGDATYAPAASGEVAVALRRRRSVVGLSGPDQVVDGRQAALAVRWSTASGTPVAGTVRLQRRDRVGRWETAAVLRTDDQGRARHLLRPRTASVWRAVAAGTAWATGTTSTVHRLAPVPPGDPVRLPAGAPRPRVRLPDQPRAVGEGAHVVVSRIPDHVWRSMVGRSWHPGCPVGRAALRLVRVNYWDYDGYRRRGEVVAHAAAAGPMGAALAQMHQRRLPIRSMYRVDRFGWSDRLQGADDYRSMAAGNTSAFNCRWVVGRPGVRSPHSYGYSLDVNPWENPYRSSHGWTPSRWWVGRSHPRVAWRSGSHPVVALMRRHGLRWTYGTSDAHHFDATRGAGRTMPRPHPACGTGVCH